MITDEQKIRAYANAFKKAAKDNPTVTKLDGETTGFSVFGTVVYYVTLAADKTLDGATCTCDGIYEHICCYHRAAAFNYYVDHTLYTKLADGWEKIIGYEDEGKSAEFVEGKEALWKKQLEKYEDLCNWRKQFLSTTKSNQAKTNLVEA